MKEMSETNICNVLIALDPDKFRVIYDRHGKIVAISSFIQKIFSNVTRVNEIVQVDEEISSHLYPEISSNQYIKLTTNPSKEVHKASIYHMNEKGLDVYILDVGNTMSLSDISDGHECMFKTILEKSPVMVWTIKGDGKYAYLNQQLLNTLHVTNDALIDWSEIVHLDDITKILNGLTHVQNEDTNMLNDNVRMKPIDELPIEDNYRWYNCKAVKLDDGSMIGFTADIDKLVSLEKHNREMVIREESATSALKLKRDFISLISHEIRTPLSAISGMANFLTSTDLDSTQSEYVDTIGNSVKILTSIIDDILEFSSIEMNDIRLRKDIFDIDRVLTEVINLLKNPAKKKNLVISVEKTRPFNTIRYGDAERIKQILLNILGNAVKFTSEGSIAITVDADDSQSDIITFIFKDTGIGMHSRTERILYEAFVQGDIGMSRKYGGLGLGMYICKKLIDLMNGLIGIKSIQGQGTVVSVSVPLPFAYGIEKNNTMEDVPITNELLEKLKKKVHILYAEDNRVNQIIMSKYLSKLGFDNLHIVEDGQYALEEYENKKYDIILLDQSMPRMNGDEVCSYIRQLDKDQILISVSANVLIRELARFADLGMNDYISKPLSLSELDLKLVKWIRYLYSKKLLTEK